jgi:hypothetical protein
MTALTARASADDAERAASFVIARVQERERRWRSGPRNPPLTCESDAPSVQLVATRHLLRMPDAVPHALVAWANGARRVALLDFVPSPRELLALQATGARCVSLLDEGIPTGAHADRLAFAVHDLCHLEKLFAPEHYEGQVGFFASLDRALADARFVAVETTLDETWIRERDAVLADMNGSCAFLFAALKNKLFLAIRRAVDPEQRGGRQGPLDDREREAFDAAFEALLDALDLHDDDRDAARGFWAKRDAEEHAPRLLDAFARRGRAILGAQ